MGASFDNPNLDPRARKRPVDPYLQTGGEAGGNPGSATPPSGGYAPDGGAPGAQHGTGFVNLQSYLGANYGAGQGMAEHVAGETERQATAEMSALSGLAAGQMVPGQLAGQVQDTAARARLTAPGGGGLGAVLGQDYGATGPYTSGQQGFDSFLTGAAGGKTLQQSANGVAGLQGQVDAFNTRAASYVPPPAAGASSAAGSGPAAGATPPQAPAGSMYSAPPPAPYSPLTYNPEQGEASKLQRPPGQAMDPWWKAPMKRGGG